MVERSDKINLMLKGNMIDDKLEKFLKENFTLNTDFNEIISYLNRNPELIKLKPSKAFKTIFESIFLNLTVNKILIELFL